MHSLSTPFRCQRVFLLVACLVVALEIFPRPALAANFYAGTSPANVPWPGGVLPYEITNSLSPVEQTTYLNGLREWELAGGVKFVPHTNQANWILFTYNTNFIDHVSGGSFSPQIITISSLSRAQVCHEMGHSFGFNHENIRVDATNYITVFTNNIYGESSNIVFFTIDPTTVPYGNYDFESVMHLGWDFESTNTGVPTQQPKPPYFPRYQFRMGNYCLSPGDRAALTYLYGPPLVPLSNVVTNTADVGPGSLRAAIYYATDHAGTTVRFNIPMSDPGYSNGVFNIHITGMLPPLVANGTVIDGSTQPGFMSKPLILVDASQIVPQTFTSDTFLIYSSSNQIKNISISGYDWNGMTLVYADATNNTISGCWIGVDHTGTNAAPNAFQGILIGSGASGNIIGGTNALARNVLSGNSQYGVIITDSNTAGTLILGNYIGTDASGSNAVPNIKSGVLIGAGAHGCTIGSTNSAGRNILSGNTEYGVFITDSSTTNNLVLGNYIGTDVSGSNAVPNKKSGVLIGGGASGNIVGSTNSAGRNILSGNHEYGVYVADTTNNVIWGNYLGLNAGGGAALANRLSGVALFGGSQNFVGGTADGAGNILSGNLEYGIEILSPANHNSVQGNLIGLDVTGTNAIANAFGGVHLGGGAQSNIIGGTVASARNIISGNPPAGVFLTDAGTSGNIVEGNYIGTDITGTNVISDGTGIYAPYGEVTGNIFGGTVPGARNIISGNYYGFYLAGAGSGGNLIEGNYIGLSPNGTQLVGSGFAGVFIFAGSTNNTIGGTVAGAGNVISGFFGYGVWISDAGTSGNVVQGNIIGADATGTNALGNGYSNIRLQLGTTNNTIGGTGAGAGNVIAFGNGAGVAVTDPGTTNNAILGNSIFSNGGLGIDLNDDGITPNDPGDADTGPNNLQNFPVITNAFGLGGSTIVQGKLNSTASRPFFVDVYRNLVGDPSGNGQGQFYLGTVTVTTDGSGNASFALTNNAGNYSGQVFSAAATSASGDTSEFGADVVATNLPAAFAQFGTSFSLHTNGFIFNLTFATNFSYHIQGTTNLATNPIPWINLTNFTAINSSMIFTDRTATNFRTRFYRVVSP